MSSPLDFAIIGAQKAASTWLTENIGRHPDILIPTEEIPCFENHFPTTQPLGESRNPTGHLVTGVKNNNLLTRPESARMLFQYRPDLRIIAVLRDPIERAISAYYWQMSVSALPIRSPSVALPQLIEERDEGLLAPGFYNQHLERFLQYFDSSQILVVLFDDIKARPADTLRAAYSFLGVNCDDAMPSLHSRPKETVYSLPRLKWNEIRNRRILYRNGTRLLWKPRLTFREKIINTLVAGTDQIVLRRILPNEKPELSFDIKRQLAEIYATDCTRLQETIRRDLSFWLTMKLSQRLQLRPPPATQL